MIRRVLIASAALASVALAQVDPVAKPQSAGVPMRIMTFNCENWSYHYSAKEALATTKPGLPEDVVAALKNARDDAEEQDWELARNVLDVQPDVWLIQEGCDWDALDRFNRLFLDAYFETLHVFKTNSERGQNTAILLKKGFKVLEYREAYHDEPDVDHVNTYNTGKLFARGPGFAKVQAPNGTQFWIGTNHAKSKSGNSVAVAKFRLAEARRTHEIIEGLAKEGPRPVIFMGDMNDELGLQEYEQEAGGSAIETLAGTGGDALLVLTKKLSDEGAISFHGGRTSMFRSFIDHAVATPEAAAWVKDVHVFDKDLADVASDHYPVVFETVVP